MSIFSRFLGTSPAKLQEIPFSNRARFTPDMTQLERKYSQLVFVYNECQSRQNKHNVLGDPRLNRRLAAGFTTSKDFVLLKKKLGEETFPLAFEITDEHRFGNSTFLGDNAQINGELYLIRSYQIESLDNYMLNTVQFHRKKVDINIPYRQKDGEWMGDRQVRKVSAWMYVAIEDFWKEQMNADKLAPVRLLTMNFNKDNVIKYYYFNDKFESNSG